MKLAKRERIGVIALLVALVALTVDRIILPTPAAVGAAQPEETAPSRDPKLLVVPDLPSPEVSTRRPVRVYNLADVFDRGRVVASVAVRSSRSEIRDTFEVRATAFTQKHALRATLLGPRPVALVGTRAVHVGETVDGFLLESVGDCEAVFVSDDQRIVLRVPARSRGN